MGGNGNDIAEYENDQDDTYYDDDEEDYQDHKNQVDTAYGLDGSSCSPEGKLTVNPNDCSSFLMCNHKKYMVRPCQDGLLWDPQYSTCNRAQNIQQQVQCKLLAHEGSVVIEKLSTKSKKEKMAAMKKLGK